MVCKWSYCVSHRLLNRMCGVRRYVPRYHLSTPVHVPRPWQYKPHGLVGYRWRQHVRFRFRCWKVSPECEKRAMNCQVMSTGCYRYLLRALRRSVFIVALRSDTRRLCHTLLTASIICRTQTRQTFPINASSSSSSGFVQFNKLLH